jgi:hypothetical protein
MIELRSREAGSALAAAEEDHARGDGVVPVDGVGTVRVPDPADRRATLLEMTQDGFSQLRQDQADARRQRGGDLCHLDAC